MTLLTLGQASDECGKHKSTVLDAIRKGRLSAHRDEKNQWQIDPAELFRVYPQNNAAVDTTNTTQHQYNTKILERERDLLLAQIDDLKNDRDHWRQTATMLLTHQPTTETASQKAPLQSSALWVKLFGNRL